MVEKNQHKNNEAGDCQHSMYLKIDDNVDTFNTQKEVVYLK